VGARTITQTAQNRASRAGEAPYLFLLFRCDAPRDGSWRVSLAQSDTVVLGRADRREVARDSGTLRIGVPDRRMSSVHARLQRVLGEWVVEDAGSKNGTVLDGRRVERRPLHDGALLELGHTFFLFRASLPETADDLLDASAFDALPMGLRTMSPALKLEFDRVALVARAQVSVLLRGETGTGKEVAARAIHELSDRKGPFVALNCGALPESLLESELFGFRKGAFTGAAEDRVGLIRTSDGGTLFLDEIGDLPLPAQAALLRVLQEGEVQSVGATRPVSVDLRVVAATHRDLEALAAQDRFRTDLLARLSGYTFSLPPLRARREDLGLLIRELLRKIAKHGDPIFSSEAARALVVHDWPLNVRELEKCLATALALAPDGRIDVEHLPASVRSPPEQKNPPRAEVAEVLSDEDRRRRDELIATLRAHDGNITAAAKAMGKPRTQVQRWLRRWKIDPLAHRR
jgi:transcriptional regulator with GAF, ATPase, and Fis domain